MAKPKKSAGDMMMLMTVEQTVAEIMAGKTLFLAADENLLKQLPKGKWIAGTIPYFMSEQGGIETNQQIFVTDVSAHPKKTQITTYTEKNLEKVALDAYDNGFSLIVIPALSPVHIAYATNAPNYPDLFLKPIIGWIAGIHLSQLGQVTPKVFNGETGEISDQKAVVMHIELPPQKAAFINIINVFEQGTGDEITFLHDGFTVQDCLINKQRENFADYLLTHKIDTKCPLVADYCGTMINVSFQKIDPDTKTVHLYAPVFENMVYKIASPILNYVQAFEQAIPENSIHPAFTCNCILNYLYSELEGKQTGEMVGPITFGEIAYQLLNQTMVYLEVKTMSSTNYATKI